MNQPHPTTQEHRAKILADLEAVWARVPHLRLGQLIANVFPDPYGPDDADLVTALRAYYALHCRKSLDPDQSDVV